MGIRVFVIASGIFAKALCHLLSEDPELRIVGDSADVHDAHLGQSSPDVIILDIETQTLTMEEAISACRREIPEVRLCMLSAHPEPERLRRGLATGANGYVFKDITPSELIRALKVIASGHSYIDPQIAGELLSRHAKSRRGHTFELTRREQEIVRLIGLGLSNRAISEKLKLSDKTVKNHVSHIFSKLDINARSQAAVHAVRTGLV